MKAILVILDGLGGRPTDLDGATCLERAATPNMDGLAQRGALGLMDPIRPGVRPGSDTSHLAIFGYDPFQVYTGRGAFEALGIGMEVRGATYASGPTSPLWRSGAGSSSWWTGGPGAWPRGRSWRGR